MKASHLPRTEHEKVGGKAFAAILGGMIVFVAILAAVTLSLRQKLREQIVSRDASVLASVTQFEVERARAMNLLYADSKDADGDESILEALLDVSRLDGVVAFRVFDSNGDFLAAAPTVFIRGGLAKADIESVRQLKPVSHFHPDASLDTFFYSIPGQNSAKGIHAALLEVIVPVYDQESGRLEGMGQFLLDGAPIATAFRQLDGNLLRQAVMAVAAVMLLGGGLLGWSFRLLHRSNSMLYARTKELVHANRELALRSRVAAIGAVTANLLHGLKNPLAALSMYVQERRRSGAGQDEGLDDADEAARRMGSMIEQSVSILGQETGQERFDYTLAEVNEVVLGQCGKNAKAGGVSIRSGDIPDRTVDNRRGNLLTLAAVNLVHNAIEASPEGSTVSLEWAVDAGENGNIRLRVADSGPGLPEVMRTDPFKPTRSGKKGGSGIGLTIAAQLVRQMGGELMLLETGEKGTVFSIGFPLREPESPLDATEG